MPTYLIEKLRGQITEEAWIALCDTFGWERRVMTEFVKEEAIKEVDGYYAGYAAGVQDVISGDYYKDAS